MQARLALIAAATSLGLIVAGAVPSIAASNTGTVTVAVTAGTQATIGVTYSAGSNILCDVGAVTSAIVSCTNTATIAGSFRSTKTNTGGASVSITGSAITGSGGSSIDPSELMLTCTGGTTGSPTFPGTPGTLATNAPLSTSAVNCQSWTGTIVSTYSLTASLSIDAADVPADTYTNGAFTATATAN